MALSYRKAREILSHGEVRGHKLTPKQRGLFGLIAGGKRPTRLSARRHRNAHRMLSRGR